MRIYGAGLLSSVAELLHAVENPDKIQRFDPDATCKQECVITAFQHGYWYTDSFEEAKEKMRYGIWSFHNFHVLMSFYKI